MKEEVYDKYMTCIEQKYNWSNIFKNKLIKDFKRYVSRTGVHYMPLA